MFAGGCKAVLIGDGQKVADIGCLQLFTRVLICEMGLYWLIFKRKLLKPFELRYFVAADLYGNKYFERYNSKLKVFQRTVEFNILSKKFNYTLKDVPMHWRMWLYNEMFYPPIDYEDPENYLL
jgi:hypothetical protein